MSEFDAHRYLPQMALPGIGKDGQQKLFNARVAVVGVGGLGCPALTSLCAMGIGELTIIDHDIVQLSNLHRQTLFSESDIGKSKSETAAQVLRQQNSQVIINPVYERLTEENVERLLAGHDVVLDASDNGETRWAIDKACGSLQIPLVYAAVSGYEGQLTVLHYKQAGGLSNLYSNPTVLSDAGTCSMQGVAGFATAVIGSLQAGEVFKIVTETGDVLAGKILTINLQTMLFRILKLK